MGTVIYGDASRDPEATIFSFASVIFFSVGWHTLKYAVGPMLFINIITTTAAADTATAAATTTNNNNNNNTPKQVFVDDSNLLGHKLVSSPVGTAHYLSRLHSSAMSL